MEILIVPLTNQAPLNLFFSIVFWFGVVIFVPIACIKIISRS